MKVTIARLAVDARTGILTLDGHALAAPPKVVELIAALAERQGEVVLKEALIERLWPGGNADDTALWQTIYLARKILARGAQAKIETHARRGYRIVSMAAAMAPPRSPRKWLVGIAAVPAVTALVLFFAFAQQRPAAVLPSHALRAYNLGRYYLHQRTVASVSDAMLEFRSVIADVPASALGYAGLSQTEVLRALQSRRERPAMLDFAIRDATKALAIDPGSADAQTTLAAAKFYASGPRNEVDASFKRALRLDDGAALTHLYYGQFLLAGGNARAAYAQLRRATDLDPSLSYANVLAAQAAYKLGDARTAIRYAREGLGFGTADKVDALETLGYAYSAIGDLNSALQAFRRLSAYAPASGAAGISYVRSLSRT